MDTKIIDLAEKLIVSLSGIAMELGLLRKQVEKLERALDKIAESPIKE